jgi:hypothetical protein
MIPNAKEFRSKEGYGDSDSEDHSFTKVRTNRKRDSPEEWSSHDAKVF